MINIPGVNVHKSEEIGHLAMEATIVVAETVKMVMVGIEVKAVSDTGLAGKTTKLTGPSDPD